MFKKFGLIGFICLIPLIWIFVKFAGLEFQPLATTFLAGIAIGAAAFLLTWASEAAERDFCGSLIIAVIALIAILPEYAVDVTLAWSAGKDITFAPYAVANMTGANRLLIGVGWTAVIFIFWLKTRKIDKNAKRGVTIGSDRRIECGMLALATIYVFTIPMKGFIAWYDAVILFLIFGFYLLKIMKMPSEECEVIGPARALAQIQDKFSRMAIWIGLMAYAAFVIFLSAEPFAHGLIESGKFFNIDEFLLVQWLAPLASEAPEFIIAILFVLRLQANKGLGILVSSEINQMTLLVGSLPVAFMLARFFTGGELVGMPLDSRQTQEIYLTASQSLLAVILLANLNFSLLEAGLIAGLFFVQLILPFPEVRLWLIFVYFGFALIEILRRPKYNFNSWKAIITIFTKK